MPSKQELQPTSFQKQATGLVNPSFEDEKERKEVYFLDQNDWIFDTFLYKYMMQINFILLTIITILYFQLGHFLTKRFENWEYFVMFILFMIMLLIQVYLCKVKKPSRFRKLSSFIAIGIQAFFIGFIIILFFRLMIEYSKSK